MNEKNSGFDDRGFGRRLRATRIALGLTEEQAAAVSFDFAQDKVRG